MVQIAPTLGNMAHNQQLHLEQIAEARAAGANVIIFPELSLTGYFLRDQVPNLAMSPDDPRLAELVAAAGEAALVVGFVERSPQHQFFNAALYAERGQILQIHRKAYLPTYGLFEEQRYFAAGDRIRAFNTETCGRVGLLVCEDFWHLSALTIMQAEEIDLLLCVANSPVRGLNGSKISSAETWELLCRTYAQTLGVAVVLVNRVGFEDGLCFWGGSMAFGPDGQPLGRAPQLDPALRIVEFDREELFRQRLATPLGRDERLLLTIEELQRIRRRRYED